ncbi:hypothetical protein ANO11243_055370 [Dothideomycetidae sp. 11243]|nr:hypothetical protein ANO11243_055370 [fungal sp. No.11243]
MSAPAAFRSAMRLSVLGGRRTFATTPLARKSATEAAKDTLKAADRTVSDQLVKGINASANAAEKAKEVAGMNSGEAKGKIDEVAGQAKGKAHEVAGKAKGKAEEVKGKM